MLEGLAAWVLNNYIGEYVENLNTHQLSIGVFQGQVELENLPLKTDALRKLDLPLEVKSGFIGRIQLTIPVKRLKSEPWVITLERLYLVAGPLKHKQYNEEEEKQRTLATKQLQLKALEEKWKAAEGTTSGGSMWGIAPMFSNILENIQLKVKDVHLRYEDDVTIPGSSFACGVTIKSLSAQSTDGSWLPKFVSKYHTDMMRRLLDLQEFSVYWDIDAEMIGSLNRSELEDALQRPMFKTATSEVFKEHEFLLEPVSAQAKMRRNTSDLPLRGSKKPRVALDIQLEKIPLSLSENQYRGMVAWMKEFSRHEKLRKYRRWKPMCKVKENPRAWWKYAIDANLHVVHDRNKRRTVDYITKRCRDNCLYVDAYIDYIAIGTTYMEERLKEHMETMETELTFEEVKVLREIGRVKMKNTVASIKEPGPPANPDGTPKSPSPAQSPTTPLSPDKPPSSGGSSTLGSPTEGKSPQGEGLFQRWFPGWGGWYGTAAPSQPLSPEDMQEEASMHAETEDDQNFEQEVLDILHDTEENNTLLRRDTVFVQLNFELQSGVFKLLHNTSTDSKSSPGILLEMECSQISMDFESRPRTNGMKFGMRVGGLYLRDKMTADSIMPVLIAPQQQRDRTSSHTRQLFTGVLGSGLGRSSSPIQPILLGGSTLPMSTSLQEQRLFELIYEKKPPQSKADYRLDIKTKPLDIVYNLTTINRVKDFFTVQKKGMTSVQSELELAAAAKSKYEAIKRQTEEELKHTIDELLEDDEKIKAKRWAFNLDIAAPQIIIPHDFTEMNTTLVVFDLGHLQFQNVTAGIKDDIKTDEEDEDDFVTPSSTPPQEQEETVAKPEQKDSTTMLADIFSEDLSEAAIRDKIYDKYKLNLSDLQVMVGKAKDNWRYAHTKGTSHLHVIDKFSISLQFDRRLLYTSDPQWPKATIAGTLPTLTLHFNEQKIHALKDCTELLTESASSGTVIETSSLTDISPDNATTPPGDQSMYYNVYQAYNKSRQSIVDTEDENMTKQAVADSVLCLMQFSINQVSLEVQSRGRSIAELQVQGVNANFTMRPYDTSVSFSIHSLLIVDALQTFGPDFELLVASHKNLCLDSQSGSMRDSEPNSPRSPQSPQSPGSPAEPAKPAPGAQRTSINVVHAASSALQGLARSVSGSLLSPEVVPMISPFSLSGTRSPSEPLAPDALYPMVNSDALIKVELDIISPNCPTNISADETLHIANVQFNNLDFIANQQTLVELLGFFQRVMPSDKKKKRKSKQQQQKEDAEKPQTVSKNKWELSAEFHRLNVLLMRVEEMELGHKVATATMSEARVNVTVASSGMEAKGSLGSVQVQNLTQEAVVAGRHQKVLSIGSDPHNLNASLSASTHSFQGPDMYKTAQDTSMFEEGSGDQALIFSLFKPSSRGDKTPVEQTIGQQYLAASAPEEIVLTLKMASLCYTHSPDFLKELSMCVTEFKDYMANVGSTLKVAATEMAIGLVSQRSTDLFCPPSNISLDGTPSFRSRRHPSMSELAMDPSFDSFSQSVEDIVGLDDVNQTVIKFDMSLETPVIILPKKPDSPQVLVVHLGRISMRNFDHPTTSTFNDSALFHRTEDQDKIFIEVRDMSMYSVDLDKQKLLQQAAQQAAKQADSVLGLNTSVMFHTPQPGGYIRTNYGTPILHDTILELTIQKMEPLNQFGNQSDNVGNDVFDPFPENSDSDDKTSSVLHVNGRLITPLKLALSKDVYEQILQTLDNITPTDEEPLESPRSDVTLEHPTYGRNLSDVLEEKESSIHSSVSALNLDDTLLSMTKEKPTTVNETVAKPEENLIFKAYFEMPIFNVEMTGDLGEGEQGLVDLRLEDFKVNFEKADPWSTSIEISLQSLIMEDLLQDKDSKHRFLMVSTQKAVSSKAEVTKLHLSQSCPTSMLDVPTPVLPHSLPSSFHEDNVFCSPPRGGKANISSINRSKSTSGYPCTPPPSPQLSRRGSQSEEDRLVHMKVLLIERKCPEFTTKYKSTNRFINVDFNGLDTTINLQTWVVLLDFLGLGAKVHNTDHYKGNHMPKSSSRLINLGSAGKDDEVTNSEIDLKVQSLSLILNKVEYELAKANISRFDSHVSLRDGTFSIKGQLGSMSLQDQSPHGNLYKERFTTTGNQALEFDIFKYGVPDPMLTREHDISVKLQMNSVWYVHTQRFLMETLAFAENFNQLQDVLGRMRAASAGQVISEKAFRGSRIKIDIEAGAPIIFIPHSAMSTDILVIDLGALSVHNTFLEAGAEGTISFKRNAHKEEQCASSEQASSSVGASGSSDASYQTSTSGLPTGQLPAMGMTDSMMTQSVYGSLEQDSRQPHSEVWESSSDTSFASSSTLVGSATDLYRSTGSLSSFYTSLGAGSPGVSSTIGAQSSPRIFPNDSSGRLRDSELLNMIQDSSDLTVSLLAESHRCLLDAWSVELTEMDLFSAEWSQKPDDDQEHEETTDLVFPSYIVKREKGKVLKDKCRLTLQVERNLEGDISHAVPDFSIDGKLTSVHFQLDLKQYKMVRGFLAHNFGEDLEPFKTHMMTELQDPQIHTVLSGNVWTGISINLDLDGVTTELLIMHGDDTQEVSLGKFEFITSRLSFDSFSDGSKDIDLVSHAIRVLDTRYRDNPVNVRPNIFPEILKPSIDRSDPKALQMELHYRSTKQFTRFTILLNNMRVMGIFDWLLACKDFLLTSPDNPYKDDDIIGDMEPPGTPKLYRQDSGVPAAVSTGVLTKRGSPAMEKKEASFELRLNVTDTELVVVEDTTGRDTNAVILKSTAVFSYKPDFAERPVSCSLQSLEVFSCSLAAEDETALSIIDPMSITMELNGSPVKKGSSIGLTGLPDATYDVDSNPPVLEISFTTLNIRLSYNDMKLFLAIMKTVPDQMIQAKQHAPPPKNAIQCKYPVEQVKKLENLGFTRDDCEKALSVSQGQLDEAALWLTQNTTPVPAKRSESTSEGFSLSGFEVKAGAICLCFIDDCLDADVPLAELTFSSVTFLHRFRTSGQGKASFKLSGDYYNRMLSGWEPFIESWGCIMQWNQGTTEENKLAVDIQAGQVLNINITRTLLEQYQKTKVKWTEDYYKQQSLSPEESGYNSRKRVPFIPFAIRNHTGCRMWFATMTTKPTRTGVSVSPGLSKDSEQLHISEWKIVPCDQEMPFLFEEREKIRHKHTHELKVHQVVVQVEGWREVGAVSIDKVGTYHRTARPEVNPTTMSSQPPARVVFDVTLEGSARKVITVRSGLMILNKLDDEVEVRLQNTLAVSPTSPTSPGSPENEKTMFIKQGARQAVPLPLVHSRIWMRPVGWSLDWCKKPVLWQHVMNPGEPSSSIKQCMQFFAVEKAAYRFCVCVYRHHFPQSQFTLGRSPTPSPDGSPRGFTYYHPGHDIILMPPVMLENLLPVDMSYALKSGGLPTRGSIKPGKMASLFGADLSQNLELGISLDNMNTSKELVVPPGTVDYKGTLLMFDNQERPLEFNVRIKAGIGGSLKLSVSAPYWLVNKTGLPLIFKQDGGKTAAGQFDEHELARSVTPLLFSFTEKERSFMCTMRLGKYIHGVTSKAMWTHRFSLERGSGVRELHVMPNDNRPDWVYMIGIEVRQGRGRYCDTNIITFSPRYQLDNRSSHKLAFAQKYAVINWSPSSVDYFSALPNCTLSFHWPRVDKDNLLCVQLMNEPDSQWSGGFRVDKVDSFHINIRSKEMKCTFLRVDIVLHGATYFVVFSDASHMPPPYRIENYSEVPVVFYQTNTRHDLRTAVRPRSQVPYALDEPVLPPHITVKVMGGSSATYNLHNVKDGDQLYYENHIYLAFTGTFKSLAVPARVSGWGSHMEQHELVLDVLPNNRVVLRKREAGKRSQLWRMTSTGMLQHEGSAAPRDPGRSPTSPTATFYVLDIADYQLRTDSDMGLAIRKAEDKRKLTQMWKFTRDGRLVCSSRLNLCVQAKGGFFGLRDGEDAVLGPSPPKITSKQDVPIEMAIHNEKSRPGSGQLSVKVLVDGPTRVLRIMDITQQRLHETDRKEGWVLVEGNTSALPAIPQNIKPGEEKAKMFELKLVLPEGIGVSLINTQPEELLYLSMKDINVNYFSSPVGQDFEITVNKFQIDNQLYGQYHPVLLFVTQFNSRHDDEEDQGPALQVSVHKVPNNQWNADIYKHVSVTMKRLTLQIEENLLWKLVQFFGFQETDADMQTFSETGVDPNREVTSATSAHLKRYYFGTLKIDIRRLMLSMLTASELSTDLKVVKKSLGMPLVKFADAQVDLEPFIRHHPFETSAFLWESITHHFTEELKSQAASILGSVDFLGNPLGFFNDVAEGVSGLLEGNVGGLFKNVTHGVSNSAAKVTSSLSDGIGVATLDNQHQKIRQQIRYESESRGKVASGSGHLVAGFKGLGHGLFGGLTSIVAQTYSGVSEDGFEGFFTGLGKGVVGTVTKPVAGVLDFAAGAASAVRDTSRNSSRIQPRRVRKPRVCRGPRGLLPAFSEEIASGQEYLHHLNDNDYSELCIAVEVLRGGRDDTLRALISNTHVYLLAKNPRNKEFVVLNPSFDELLNCRSMLQEGKQYLMLIMKADTEQRMPGEENKKCPLVRCDNERVAQRASQQINYARSLYDEVRHTLPADSLDFLAGLY